MLAVDAVGWFGIALVAAVLLVLFISLPIYERVKRQRESVQRKMKER
jgi:hypothetical protein